MNSLAERGTAEAEGDFLGKGTFKCAEADSFFRRPCIDSVVEVFEK